MASADKMAKAITPGKMRIHLDPKMRFISLLLHKARSENRKNTPDIVRNILTNFSVSWRIYKTGVQPSETILISRWYSFFTDITDR